MEQDPLASAAPVLQSGPGALDIGYKRMGIEQEAGKLAAAQKDALDKLKDAQKERNAAAFKIDAEVPFFTHKAAFAQDWKAEEDWLAQKMMDFDQGKGDDPMDPTSKAGIERQFRAQQLKLKTGYSKQMGDMYVKATEYIDKNYQNLKPGTKEKLDDWASNIENLNQGKVYDPIVGNIDLNKVVQGQLKELATSTTGNAWIDPVTGQSHSFQTDQIIAPQVLAGIQGVLSDHYNREQAEYDAAEIAISDPVRYKRVVELAAKNNIPVADALIFDYAAPVYTMRSHTETVGQPNTGFGDESRLKAASNELVQMYKGVVEGTHRGMTPKEAFKKESDLVALAKTVANNEALQPYMTADGSIKPGYRLITNLNRLSTGTKRTKTTSGGVSDPVEKKIRFAIQDEDTKNIIVVSGVDSEWTSGKPDVSEAISPSQLWSKVFVPGEMYTGEGKTYPIGSGELALRNAGINIEGTEANINPENKGAQYVAPGTAEKGTAPKAETPKKKAY